MCVARVCPVLQLCLPDRSDGDGSFNFSFFLVRVMSPLSICGKITSEFPKHIMDKPLTYLSGFCTLCRPKSPTTAVAIDTHVIHTSASVSFVCAFVLSLVRKNILLFHVDGGEHTRSPEQARSDRRTLLTDLFRRRI